MDDDKVEETFEDVEKLLNAMVKDRAVPRNIKEIAKKGLEQLNREDESPGVISSNIIYLIDDLSQDPNIPFHVRTNVYRVMTLLEKIQD